MGMLQMTRRRSLSVTPSLARRSVLLTRRSYRGKIRLRARGMAVVASVAVVVVTIMAIVATTPVAVVVQSRLARKVAAMGQTVTEVCGLAPVIPAVVLRRRNDGESRLRSGRRN